MRVIAYTQRLTPAFYRRIGAIFSILTNRGHTAVYQQIHSTRQIRGGSYDVVLLCDWVGDGVVLPEILGRYIYDLSDGELYLDPSARSIMEQCSAIFVPSAGIKRVVSQHHKVVVQPSAVPTQFLTQFRVTKSPAQRVVLLRPFDWQSIRQVFDELVTRRAVEIVTDSPGLASVIPPANLRYIADLEPMDYLAACRSATLALFPGISPAGDPGCVLDFGYVGTPGIVSPIYAADLPEKTATVCRKITDWSSTLTALLDDDRKRSLMSGAAQQIARRFSATRVADEWWTRAEKCCAISG